MHACFNPRPAKGRPFPPSSGKDERLAPGYASSLSDRHRLDKPGLDSGDGEHGAAKVVFGALSSRTAAARAFLGQSPLGFGHIAPDRRRIAVGPTAHLNGYHLHGSAIPACRRSRTRRKPHKKIDNLRTITAVCKLNCGGLTESPEGEQVSIPARVHPSRRSTPAYELSETGWLLPDRRRPRSGPLSLTIRILRGQTCDRAGVGPDSPSPDAQVHRAGLPTRFCLRSRSQSITSVTHAEETAPNRAPRIQRVAVCWP